MNIKFLLAVGLTLSTIGLAFPTLAGSNNYQCIKNSSPKPCGRYYPHEQYGVGLSGIKIYVGLRGDYYKQGKHYSSRQYSQYYNQNYDYQQRGDYYEGGQYHQAIFLIYDR